MKPFVLLATRAGATIDRRHGEPISVTEVILTEAVRVDPLLAGVPIAFSAFVGHKEAISAHFEPHEFQATINAVHRAPVTQTGAVLRNFVARYAR